MLVLLHRAAAEQFAEIGANLVLVARRAERLQELKSRLESAFGVCPHSCWISRLARLLTFAFALEIIAETFNQL